MSRYYDLLKEFGYRETQGFGRTAFALLNPSLYSDRFHDGRDFTYSSPKNNACKVMFDGKVTYVGFGGKYGRDYGNIVEIEVSPNTFMVYAHLDRFLPLAKVGDIRKVGDDIGIIGKSGTSKSTGIHVHLLLRQLGQKVDPKLWIDTNYKEDKPMPEKEVKFTGEDYITRLCENYEILLVYPDLFLSHKFKFKDGEFDWNSKGGFRDEVKWWAENRTKEQYKQAIEEQYRTWLKEQK
jgi:murein DD-endopeptidase MepM/ murein hydrolase activator NlpD